jgi:hypothetical protein
LDEYLLQIYFAKWTKLVLFCISGTHVTCQQNCEVYKADEILQELKFWGKTELTRVFFVGKNLLVMARLIHHLNHDSKYFEAMKKSSAIFNLVEHNIRNA